MSTTILANQIYSQQLLASEESMLSIVDKSKSPAIQNLFTNQVKEPGEKKARGGKIGKNRRNTLENS